VAQIPPATCPPQKLPIQKQEEVYHHQPSELRRVPSSKIILLIIIISRRSSAAECPAVVERNGFALSDPGIGMNE
jgi:hypothetical protein